MSRLLRAIGIVSSLIGITFSTAQTQDTGASASKEQDAETRPIEEITVLGERSFYTLRLEIETAEEEVYGLFNELNTMMTSMLRVLGKSTLALISSDAAAWLLT